MESESVYVATLFCAAADEMIALAEFLGNTSDAARFRTFFETMKDRINDRAWDGEWYRRVLVKGGGYIGSRGNDPGSIFVEPQPWAVMSGVAEGDRAERTMASVNRLLATEYGIRLVWKPFSEYDPRIGSISIVLPGTKENGSVFHHPNPWVICAETVLGHGERAMDYFRRISPTTKNRIVETHQVEPYVFCQWTGLDPFKHVGRGANPWITGTAAWVMLSLSQYILGIRPDWTGLRIDPCVPKSWKKFRVTRLFRDARYEIAVENPKGVEKGVRSVTLDGRPLDGNVVPAQDAGTTHEVLVTMG
jgi:cellobiose phosphorylase